MENVDLLNTGMFKSYDIRTKEELLTPGMIKRLLDATAVYFIDVARVESIVLSHDARLGCPALLEEAISLFPLYGINVIFNPLVVSTPQFYYSAMENPFSAGIMFTASHNPGDYVGMKIILPGLVPLSYDSGPEGGIRRIKELYIEERRPRIGAQRGRVYIKSYLDAYVSYSLRLAGVEEGSLKGLSILCDFLSGAAGGEITSALTYLGADVKPLHIIPDGRFPSGDPNPIVLSSIEEAKAEMRKREYDFGLIFDGDGDRMDVMMASTEQLQPSFNFSIIMERIKRIYGKTFPRIRTYLDVKANPVAVKNLSSCCDVGLIRNGHSYIKETLLNEMSQGCVASCEESGHYYMNFPYKTDDFSLGFAPTENTLFYAVLTSWMMKEKPFLYKNAIREQKKTVREREWTRHFDDRNTMEAVQEKIKRRLIECLFYSYDTSFDSKSLDALLFRRNLPLRITKDTPLDGEWVQVVQRESRSEDNILRWEITGGDEKSVKETKKAIDECL